MIDSAATDHIVEEVQSRRARLWEIDDRFGVLLHPTQLVCKDEDEIGAVCKNIAKNTTETSRCHIRLH